MTTAAARVLHRRACAPDDHEHKNDYHQHYVGGGMTEWHQHGPPAYPPMTPAWVDGYRKGMEYCLATIQPLLRADATHDAIREAVRMLNGQLPEVPTPEPATKASNDTQAILAAIRAEQDSYYPGTSVRDLVRMANTIKENPAA